MPRYFVETHNVDGRAPRRKYKTLDAALKRFIEMAGGTVEGWIAESFYDRDVKPKIEKLYRLRAVSDYGTVVVFGKVD